MSHRPSFVLPLLVALCACTGSAPAGTEAAGDKGQDNAGGATSFGIGTGLIVKEQLIRELDTHDPILKVEVRLTPPNYTVVYVKYSTVDGSAKAGEDYQAVQGTLRFDPGELVKTIEIPVLGDELEEGEEQFVLMLQLVSKARTMEPIKVPMTIMDDD